MPRLIEYLRSIPLTNKEANDLLDTGKVFYCGVPTADRGREVDTSKVEIRRSAPRIRPNLDLSIIYRDEELSVVFKPAGMMSVRAVGRRGEKDVIGEVRRLLGDAYPVHRLDEMTSGVMMVALSMDSQYAIKQILFEHKVERRYLAIVSGIFPDKPMTIRTQLVRDRGDGLRGSSYGVNEDNSKEAVTHLKLIERLGKTASLVEASLETGRTHQVRIHLSESKFPILGDELYAPARVVRAAPRLALHAYRLGFTHPKTGKPLVFDCPLADDLESLRRRLLGLARENAP